MKSLTRIVLVEPREAGNVGAVARAMKNFGLSDLVIVGEMPPLHPIAEWWSSGAEDLVAGVRHVATLHEAISDSHLTVATTSSRGRVIEDDLSPREIGALSSDLREGEILALVFGREDRGLTREETMLCHRRAVVPTNPDFPTMNLAQTVAIFCYQLSLVVTARGAVEPHPDAALIERLHHHAQRLLIEAGFLNDSNSDRMYGEVRSMVGRLNLTERETTILLGMVRQLEWRIRHP